MIAALLIGRAGSVGFPGKNTMTVMGHPFMEYPLLAALYSQSVDEVYVSTDSQEIMDITKRNGANVIVRPDYLCTKEAHGEDAFVHGYKYIRDELGKDVELMVLLHCNAPCVLPAQIEEGVRVLRERPELDSAVTVSRYNMYSTVRARRIGEDGLLHPFIPFENYPKDMVISCDRDEQGDTWFADVCLSVVRPRCLEDLSYGVLPQRWMGQKIYPIKQECGIDIDYEWQLGQAEAWLRSNGFSEGKIPYRRKGK